MRRGLILPWGEKMENKIVCIGAVNVDTILYVKDFCGDDGEEVIKDKQVFSGGQAGNVAAGLGKLGKNAFFVGNIGDDENTSMLLKDFDDCNVDYSLAKKTCNPNNSVYSLVETGGERRMYTYNNVDLNLDDFPEEVYENTSFIVFTSLIKDGVIDLYVEIAKKAKKSGIKIALDPGNIFARLGFEKLKPLLELCDYIFPSLNEVDLMVGGIENVSRLREIVPNIIVTCGGKGVRFYSGNNEGHIPVFGKIQVVDTTGAGDCFAAAFISTLIDGGDVRAAIDFAIYAGRLSISKKGARSMPEREEVVKFMKDSLSSI